MSRPRHRRRTLTTLSVAVAVALLCPALAVARRDRLELRYQSIELPGAPSAILPADLDGDGRIDLAVAVAYTEWHQIGIEEVTELDEVAGLVEVLTIVPSLIDRRELRVFLADGDGYRALPALELDRSVLSFEIGPPGLPIVALTDSGLSALSLSGDGAGRAPVLEPVLEDRPVLAGTGTFIPDLGLIHDLDGDGDRDLLFPATGGAAVYLGHSGGLASEPASRPPWPAEDRDDDRETSRTRRSHHYPLPQVRDVDGDGLADLLLLGRDGGWERFHVLRNLGGGRFAPALRIDHEDDEDTDATRDRGDSENDDDNQTLDLVYFGDLDGDGVAEYVTQEELDDDDAGMRQEMREAKQPPFRYRLHRSGPDLAVAGEPYFEFEAIGYALDGGGDEREIRLPGGFQDLDGDGRSDLVTLTLDFSLMQAVRILTTHRITIGMDFHVWCQDDAGRFRAVRGLDLSGKFKLDLDDLRVGRMSQFAGDFDADGKADFVQLGRGRDVTIHRGREGCVYPPEPDLRVRLEEEPRDLNLVRVEDFDGDGRTDLLVIQPQKVTEPGVTPPVRLDLYRSSGSGE